VWVPLAELSEGETLQGSDGPAIVLSVSLSRVSQPVYNVEVHNEHVYQVGEIGVLVHNSCFDDAPDRLPPITPPTNRGGLRQAMGQPPAGMTNPNAHHDLPWTMRDWFAQRGLNVNYPRFGRWVEGTPPGGHQRWSAEFDAEWRQFRLDNPGATADEVIAFMNRLRTDPRFQ
jgi:hypothetical protein